MCWVCNVVPDTKPGGFWYWLIVAMIGIGQSTLVVLAMYLFCILVMHP